MTTYTWTDNATQTGKPCNVDVLNNNLMHLKYNQLIPDWSNLITITEALTDYVAPKNGYLMLVPITTVNGTITINGTTIQLKMYAASADAGSNLISLPVAKDDVITTSMRLAYKYFLPTK